MGADALLTLNGLAVLDEARLKAYNTPLLMCNAVSPPHQPALARNGQRLVSYSLLPQRQIEIPRNWSSHLVSLRRMRLGGKRL